MADTYFTQQVHNDWLMSSSPAKVISTQCPQNVTISCNAALCRRHTSAWVVLSWTFKVLATGKTLRHVSLTLDENRSIFSVASVYKNGIECRIRNSQEWYESDPEFNQPLTSNTNRRTEYIVRICCQARRYGTYRQNVIFGFQEYPVVLRRICVDCLPREDLIRIQTATEYQLSQNPKYWPDEAEILHKFKSPFVPQRDKKEDEFSAMYPYPNKDNFFLTQESLTDDCLTESNYRGRLHELISIEELARHEQIARYRNVSYMRLLSHYILVSAGDAATVTKYAPSGELFAQLPLSRNTSEDTRSGRLFLRGCSSLLFKTTSSISGPLVVYEAHIEDVCTQSVYVRLSKECVDKFNLMADMDLEVEVQFLLSRLPFCEWHRAVDSLPDIKLVFPNIKMSVNDFISLNALTTDIIQDDMLNAEQKKAMAVMTAPIEIIMPPILLFGPFGTGKTFTIAHALRILLTQNARHKILLCTHSNSAADLYVRDFFDSWYKAYRNPRLKPIRVYYKDRARNTVHPIVQEYSLMENGSFRNPRQEDFLESGLIITTLTTASSLTSMNLPLTHIVIDEAAQALECEILIPLALATLNTRLILAGDQMQLAPEVYSDLASERGLGVSLLERIYKIYPENHPCRIQLCQNYRAHADIIAFTSEIFYDGKITPGQNVLMRHPIFKPLTFYAVSGEELQDIHSTGYVHASEAYEIANRVHELKSNWPVDQWGSYGDGSIGVLAYYADQVQRIRAELRKRKLFDVSVERVLNVQGKQFTAVFISTVRTRNCCRYAAERNLKDYGFLTNPRLVNTAITRAKCLVAVVGDPVALLTIGSCRKLWQRYLEMADLYGINLENLKYHLSLVPELPRGTPLNPLANEFVPRNSQPVCIIEYVPVPMMYPIVHYNLHHT